MAKAGLPGLRGGDHIGITVPDLEAATAFFVDVLGAQRFYDLGPFESDGDWMETHLGVARDARVDRLRFLRLGTGLNLELFEYAVRTRPRSSPATATWVVSTSPSMSTTSTPHSTTSGRTVCRSWGSRRFARAVRVEVRPGCTSWPLGASSWSW